MTARLNLTISDDAARVLDARGGERGKSALITRLLVAHERAIRHAEGVCIAYRLEAHERAACADALHGLWSEGHQDPSAIAGELHDAAALYRGDEAVNVRHGVDGDRWREIVEAVGQSPELAHALVTLSRS
jgi:hypothetical protein